MIKKIINDQLVIGSTPNQKSAKIGKNRQNQKNRQKSAKNRQNQKNRQKSAVPY